MNRSESSRIAVVLLSMNQRELTLRCLESLHAVDEVEPGIVVWDNGSIDGTAEAVSSAFPQVTIHSEPTNVGVASGRNRGAAIADSGFDPDFYFFLDNDMTVEPDSLGLLVAPFADIPKLAQTTGKIRQLREGGMLYGAGGCRIRFRHGDTGHVGYGEIDHGQYDRPARCIASGGCMMVRRSVFEQLGGFDTVFDPYGPEDLDFGLRAVAAGYHGLYVPQAIVYHEPRPGRTFDRGSYSEGYASNRARHWMILMRRHASLRERLAFYLLGAPRLLLALVVREARRGNLRPALRGLAKGVLTRRSDKEP